MYLQKVINRKTLEKISFLLASYRSLTKITGSISQRQGFADPDPFQNVMEDQQNWLPISIPTVARGGRLGLSKA
jgi:hypothetical protein